MSVPVTTSSKATDYFANERTFLAWIRTCIAIISLGFVVAKFGIWLSELAKQLNSNVTMHRSGLSMPLGIGMMALGGMLAIVSAWHYHLMNLAIARGEVRANLSLVVAVTAAVAILSILMIVYMIVSAKAA